MQIGADALSASELSFTGSTLEAIKGYIAVHGYLKITEVPEGFDYPGELTRLGDPMGQYDGLPVRDIKPDPNLEPGAYSALSMDQLNPHTEWYEVAGTPPRYVTLWCVEPSRGPGGETTLADGYRLLDDFSDVDRLDMRVRSYKWYGLKVEGSAIGRDGPVMHPIVEEHPAGLILRYSYAYVERVEDGLMPRYIDGGQRFFAENHVAIPLSRGDILIWDNWRMIHARNAFTDPRRHLRRMLLSHASG